MNQAQAEAGAVVEVDLSSLLGAVIVAGLALLALAATVDQWGPWALHRWDRYWQRRSEYRARMAAEGARDDLARVGRDAGRCGR